jgi:hypothetical protein
MRKLIFLFLLIACSGLLCQAQSSGGQKNEFFAGYSYQSADINTLTIDPRRTSQKGVNLAYTRYVTKNLGVTTDLTAHWHRDSTGIPGGTFSRKRDQYSVLGGLQYKRHDENRLQPFVHALAGISLFRGFTSRITGTGNVFTFDDVTGFAMAFGGGLDIRVGKRVDVRLFQADYSPTHFGSGWQNNFRISFGVVFKH